MITPVLAVLSTALPTGPVAEVPDWAHFYGDLRLRLEHNLDNNASGDDRTRARIRARFGARFDITDDFKAELRMTTRNNGDANSVNIDLGSTDEGQGSADAGIDRMNVTWIPSEDWTVKAGKMGNPFALNPVVDQYVWDSDIQPQGIFTKWAPQSDMQFDVRLGYFVVTENSAAADATVTTGQVNFGMATESVDWGVHSSLSNWSAESGYLSSFAFVQMEDFLVWDTILEAKVDDLTFSAQYINNLDDDSGDDTGMVLGMKYGQGGAVGTSVFSASYFDFDANAFVSGVAQDDTPIAGTGGPNGMDGFDASWLYWWKENVTVKLHAIQADNDTIDPLRLRLDVVVALKR